VLFVSCAPGVPCVACGPVLCALRTFPFVFCLYPALRTLCPLVRFPCTLFPCAWGLVLSVFVALPFVPPLLYPLRIPSEIFACLVHLCTCTRFFPPFEACARARACALACTHASIRAQTRTHTHRHMYTNLYTYTHITTTTTPTTNINIDPPYDHTIMRFSCDFHAIFMRFSCDFHAIFMRFSCDFHAICLQPHLICTCRVSF
jgi:hypothetical protein